MGEFLTGYPFWAVWLFLYLGATIRGQATYWLGRGVLTGARRARRGQQDPTHPRASAGRRVIDRVGLVAVPFAYLTVGLQSAIIFAAGLIRIPWRRFSLAQIPGALAWATIYSTIGFAAWVSLARAFAGQWWPLALLVLGAAAVVVIIVHRRRRSRPAAEVPPAPADNSLSTAPPHPGNYSS